MASGFTVGHTGVSIDYKENTVAGATWAEEESSERERIVKGVFSFSRDTPNIIKESAG